jgi:predicted SprT family Zn-dependent metalloprotease
MKGPKILTLDIETSPMEVYSYGLYDQNHGVDQIIKDWQLLSFAAKWLHKKTVIQNDMSKGSEEDLVVDLRLLMEQADIIVTQNGKKFDIKKINAKIIEYSLKPAKRCQQFDTRMEAKKLYNFPSYSLEYMSKKLNKKYTKLKHKKFPGQELWTECLNNNPKAWKEMAKYNKWDVLATEELFIKMRPYSNAINWCVYYGTDELICGCGSAKFNDNGHNYTATGKFKRYSCAKCGQELKHKKNLHKGKFRKI